MNIVKELEGTTLTVKLEGRLDTLTAPELEEDMQESLEGVTDLVVDLEALEYVSSAGLRVLLRLMKQMKQQMVIRNVSELVNEVFEVTGFSDIFTIE
ncbi:MAG: STAS domain-containing protein [Lachnospiraceae bacterium]|nr:STAS domain-containing protein [Lachnospiraceae bacterium]MDD7149032.1 STAS domain-containing protein [Lachnospiraceae bacterium]MDY4069823.1 STAS domain-containing protein [Lachnospiraceae bacterium]